MSIFTRKRSAYFFEPFNAQRAAEQQLARYGIPVAESLRKWDRIGRLASEVGTFVHEQTENYFQHGEFLTEYPFTYDGCTETINVDAERRQFLAFVTDHHIQPYRQEWPVYDVSLNLAGTVDHICREPDGTFTIYDWKRSRKVSDACGRPITEAFGGRTSLNGITIPDTSYYHYCLQQNLYRYMLQQNYGIRINAMNLVVLNADYGSYHIVKVPIMDALIQQVVSLCRDQHLGTALLK